MNFLSHLAEAGNHASPEGHPECNHHEFIYHHQTSDFLCSTAAAICGEKIDLVNYFEIHWCYLGGMLPIFIPLTLIIIYLTFSYIAIVIDEYVAEGIQKISDFLGLSETVAAVTLLAFANGAGDFITSLVASDSEGGVAYNIGALFGAGLFVVSLVVSVCIFQ